MIKFIFISSGIFCAMNNKNHMFGDSYQSYGFDTLEKIGDHSLKDVYHNEVYRDRPGNFCILNLVLVENDEKVMMELNQKLLSYKQYQLKGTIYV